MFRVKREPGEHHATAHHLALPPDHPAGGGDPAGHLPGRRAAVCSGVAGDRRGRPRPAAGATAAGATGRPRRLGRLRRRAAGHHLPPRSLHRSHQGWDLRTRPRRPGAPGRRGDGGDHRRHGAGSAEPVLHHHQGAHRPQRLLRIHGSAAGPLLLPLRGRAGGAPRGRRRAAGAGRRPPRQRQGFGRGGGRRRPPHFPSLRVSDQRAGPPRDPDDGDGPLSDRRGALRRVSALRPGRRFHAVGAQGSPAGGGRGRVRHHPPAGERLCGQRRGPRRRRPRAAGCHGVLPAGRGAVGHRQHPNRRGGALRARGRSGRPRHPPGLGRGDLHPRRAHPGGAA